MTDTVDPDRGTVPIDDAADERPRHLAPTPPPPWRRPPVVVVTVAVVVAALTGIFTRSTDDPERTSDVGATTTTAAGEPTATSAPPSASGEDPTATAGDPSSVRSVIVALEGVVGWWDGERFVRTDDGDDVPAEGGESYTLLGIGQPPRTAVGSAPEDGCSITDPPGVTIDVGIEASPSAAGGPPPIAVSGVRDAVPRPVEVLPTHQAYIDAASEALADLGVDDPAPELRQVVRTDFEGDGRDEVLIVADRVSDADGLVAAPGDHSVVLLRQLVDGEVATTVVAESVVPESGDDATPYLLVSQVAAVADLNGDGVTELVVHGRHDEGSSTTVHQLDPRGGVEELLSVGCGT